MTNKEIKHILISKDVNKLYHANSVETSLTFLKNNGLMSRGICEQDNLPQSPQLSDNQDKKLGIYYDIFFDSVDIHKRTHNANFYGPVLFVYNIDVLDSVDEGSVKITKNNPIYWKHNAPENERYFTNINDLYQNFCKGNFGQHITIANRYTPLPFDHIESVVLNFPANAHDAFFEKAYKSISHLTKFHNIPLCAERCNPDCKCNQFYNQPNNKIKFFDLRRHSI